MMGDFPHLRIVEVLVKCCCPWIPSQAAVTAPVTENGKGLVRGGSEHIYGLAEGGRGGDEGEVGGGGRGKVLTMH